MTVRHDPYGGSPPLPASVSNPNDSLTVAIPLALVVVVCGFAWMLWPRRPAPSAP